MHTCVFIPVMIDPIETDYSKFTANPHPETSSDVKPLPFLWSVALFRFVSRMSIRLDTRDRGIAPRTITVYRLNKELFSIWKVNINHIASELISLLLTGSNNSVFNLDDRLPGCAEPVWSRGTRSHSEVRMSVENVVIAATEEANGAKIARGAKRCLWQQVEAIEAAMFIWTIHAIQRANSPTTIGWTTVLSHVKFDIRNTDVMNRVKQLWLNYIETKKSIATAQIPEPLPGMPPLPKGSPPLPQRISNPMIPTYSTDKYLTIQPIRFEDVTDSFESVKYDEIVCEENELKGINEMIVRSFIEKEGTSIFTKSWSLFPISSRLEVERKIWGLTRSLLI